MFKIFVDSLFILKNISYSAAINTNVFPKWSNLFQDLKLLDFCHQLDVQSIAVNELLFLALLSNLLTNFLNLAFLFIRFFIHQRNRYIFAKTTCQFNLIIFVIILFIFWIFLKLCNFATTIFIFIFSIFL